jgi:hypothetical protein
MTLPTSIYLNSTQIYIYQLQYDSLGVREKRVTEERTITGQRSRQLGWGPRTFAMTLWLRNTEKTFLDNLWESETNTSYCTTLKIDSLTSMSYSVTFDEYTVAPHEAVDDRYLANVKFTEWI